jgi:hypothetical protein
MWHHTAMRHQALALLTTFALLITSAACGPGGRSGGDGADGGGQDDCSPGATMDCYTGPAGTSGTGLCHGGTMTCSDDGHWGNCDGQVTPVAEACGNGVDDDCDGTIDNDVDVDGDGFSSCDGDCCETTGQCGEPTRVGPAAIEVPTASGEVPVDDNCNGVTDEVEPGCTENGALASTDPLAGAAAIGLCPRDTTLQPARILLDADYVRGGGSVLTSSSQFGVMTTFGSIQPRAGARLLGLSTGRARDGNDPGACGSHSCLNSIFGDVPDGFPQDVPGCEPALFVCDDVGLRVRLKAPQNAVGFSVDHRFFTFEYPEYVCSEFNDQFIIYVTPAPAGSIMGNIAFDSMTNPVSVNIGFFDVCSGCSAGAGDLTGTGFDTWNSAGGTTWLRSQAPVTGGQEFTITFLIWDTGDTNWDSTALIDNFQWILEGSPGVITEPID